MKEKNLKEKAIKYRKSGYSYNIITKKTGLSKSTLSNWLREIPYKPNKETLSRIGIGKLKSAQSKNNQKLSEIIEMKRLGKKEIGKITKRDLFMLGIGLYLGEGSKIYENIRIINSDPSIIKISVKWFLKICQLKKENLNPVVHIYPDNNIDESINFWSKITKVPKKQFGKTQIDTRKEKSIKKKGRLPYGTLHLQVRSCGNKKFGKSLHRKIMGWIEAVINQV